MYITHIACISFVNVSVFGQLKKNVLQVKRGNKKQKKLVFESLCNYTKPNTLLSMSGGMTVSNIWNPSVVLKRAY